jgi:hypothetical protein
MCARSGLAKPFFSWTKIRECGMLVEKWEKRWRSCVVTSPNVLYQSYSFPVLPHWWKLFLTISHLLLHPWETKYEKTMGEKNIRSRLPHKSRTVELIKVSRLGEPKRRRYTPTSCAHTIPPAYLQTSDGVEGKCGEKKKTEDRYPSPG